MARPYNLRPVRAAASRVAMGLPSNRGGGLSARAGFLLPGLFATFGLGTATVFAVARWLNPGSALGSPTLLLLALAATIVTLAWAGARLYLGLLRPLSALEESVGRVCQGEPEVQLARERAGALRGLVEDVHSLSEELIGLYEDMDNRVARQTRRLAQKTASLKILYEVAASVNHADDLTQLLVRYLRVIRDMVKGRAATVRLREPDGRLRVVGSLGMDNSVLMEHEMLPLPLCRCGRVLVPGEILCTQDAEECSRRNGRRMYGSDQIDALEVPLQYHDDLLGMYRVYADHRAIAGREEVLELMTTIGSHLGMAVAKQRSDAEARRLSIVEERTHLAHELHDSLAQTLASLRFQVRMLQDTLEQEGVGEAALAEGHRIRNGLDEAHTELRELLNSFRAPLDQRGLMPALEKLSTQFRQETGLAVFFQRDCRQLQLSAHEEMQMLRIVQESLANVRKHAQAHTVRIYLRCRAPGTYLLLVEDDGVGFDRSPEGGRPGEHIGLSIMEERARRIGAQLRIESEPGEGTRVELMFTPGRRLMAAAGEGKS